MLAEPALKHLESWDLILAGLLEKSSTVGDIVVAWSVADQSKQLIAVEIVGLYNGSAAAQCECVVVTEIGAGDSENANAAGGSKLSAEVEIVDSGSELADQSKTLLTIDNFDFGSSPVAVAVPSAATSEIVVQPGDFAVHMSPGLACPG